MTDKNKIKIAKAFFSKPRGVFMPLTADDIQARSKLPQGVCDNARISMLYDGLITASKSKGVAAYTLTPLGQMISEAAQ